MVFKLMVLHTETLAPPSLISRHYEALNANAAPVVCPEKEKNKKKRKVKDSQDEHSVPSAEDQAFLFFVLPSRGPELGSLGRVVFVCARELVSVCGRVRPPYPLQSLVVWRSSFLQSS